MVVNESFLPPLAQGYDRGINPSLLPPLVCRDTTREFTTTLVEPDKTDALALTEGFVTDYIRQYVSSAPPAGTAAPLPEESQPLFLARNLAAKGQVCSEEAIVGAQQQVIVQNGLECKISCATNKVGRTSLWAEHVWMW